MIGELVSIIIPAYNVEKYIERCLESLQKQSYTNIEVIVVNDGSKDGTGAICDRYVSADSRIKVLHIPNGGVSNARNTGLKEACGKYIMFVDSDDYVTDNYVEANYKAITKEDADMSICGAYFEYPDKVITNKVDDKYVGTFEEQEFKDVFWWLYQNYFTHVIWNKMYKRKMIEKFFRTDMSWGEDVYFNLEYLKNVQKVSISGEVCYHYRCEENQASLTKRVSADKFSCEDILYQKLTETFRNMGMGDVSEVARIYGKNTISMLFQVAYSNMNAKERRKIIADVCEMQSVAEVMPAVKMEEFYSEWIRVLLKKKSVKVLSFLFGMARIARKMLDFISRKKRT